MQNHYKILGISQDANPNEIKETAQAKANEIKVIYETLVDTTKRQTYDAKLQADSSAQTNYYEILAVNQHASEVEIKKAAQARMDIMKTAFSVLYDPKKREAYDLELTQNSSTDDAETINQLSQKLSSQPQVSPYQPPSVEMQEVDEGDFELAGRGVRLLAYIIDTVLIILPIFILIFVLGMETEEIVGDDNMVGVFGVLIALWFLALFVINMVLLYQNGQTIGKRMLAIKIVQVDGSRASLLRIIFLRALPVGILSSIPILGNLFFLIDALLIFQDSRRCLHDLIAGTIVINANKKDLGPYQTSLSA